MPYEHSPSVVSLRAEKTLVEHTNLISNPHKHGFLGGVNTPSAHVHKPEWFPGVPVPAFLGVSTATMRKSRRIFIYSSSESALTDFPSAQTHQSWSAIWEMTSSGYCDVKSSTILVLGADGSAKAENPARKTPSYQTSATSFGRTVTQWIGEQRGA